MCTKLLTSTSMMLHNKTLVFLRASDTVCHITFSQGISTIGGKGSKEAVEFHSDLAWNSEAPRISAGLVPKQ